MAPPAAIRPTGDEIGKEMGIAWSVNDLPRRLVNDPEKAGPASGKK
jgi:hypothetical protein